MSKKFEKVILMLVIIKEQMEVFLKVGGMVEQIGKGESGQFFYLVLKQVNQKK